MEIVSNDQLNKSRRAIYINSASLAGAVAGAGWLAITWMPDSLLMKVIVAIFSLSGFYGASAYVCRSTKAIDEYIATRDEYLKTMKR